MSKLFTMMNNATAMHGMNHASNSACNNANTKTKVNMNLVKMGNLGIPMING